MHIKKKIQIILICFPLSRKEVSRQNQEIPIEDSNSTCWEQYVSNPSLTQKCVIFRKLLPLSASIYPLPTKFSEPLFCDLLHDSPSLPGEEKKCLALSNLTQGILGDVRCRLDISRLGWTCT